MELLGPINSDIAAVCIVLRNMKIFSRKLRNDTMNLSEAESTR